MLLIDFPFFFKVLFCPLFLLGVLFPVELKLVVGPFGVLGARATGGFTDYESCPSAEEVSASSPSVFQPFDVWLVLSVIMLKDEERWCVKTAIAKALKQRLEVRRGKGSTLPNSIFCSWEWTLGPSLLCLGALPCLPCCYYWGSFPESSLYSSPCHEFGLAVIGWKGKWESSLTWKNQIKWWHQLLTNPPCGRTLSPDPGGSAWPSRPLLKPLSVGSHFLRGISSFCDSDDEEDEDELERERFFLLFLKSEIIEKIIHVIYLSCRVNECQHLSYL